MTAAWGSTFFMLKDVVEKVPVPDFLAVRFVLATGALLLLRPRSVLRLTAVERRRGMALGVVYGVAQVAQSAGIQHTSASVSGFVTGMSVVFTPLLAAALLRARIGRAVWLSVVLATVGLGALSLTGVAIGGGEALTLVGALLYAVHIVGLGAWSRSGNTLGLATVQLAAVSVVCGIGAVPSGITLPDGTFDWLVLVYMAVVAGALALVVQTWAQARLSAARAAVIMTMEPVWAAVFAVAIGGESLGPRVVLGGALVLVAMYLAEHGPSRPTSRTSKRGGERRAQNSSETT